MKPAIPSQPWYRQFWPWFIILLPLCAVLASVSVATIAIIGADDVVQEDAAGPALSRRSWQEGLKQQALERNPTTEDAQP